MRKCGQCLPLRNGWNAIWANRPGNRCNQDGSIGWYSGHRKAATVHQNWATGAICAGRYPLVHKAAKFH